MGKSFKYTFPPSFPLALVISEEGRIPTGLLTRGGVWEAAAACEKPTAISAAKCMHVSRRQAFCCLDEANECSSSSRLFVLLMILFSCENVREGSCSSDDVRSECLVCFPPAWHGSIAGFLRQVHELDGLNVKRWRRDDSDRPRQILSAVLFL